MSVGFMVQEMKRNIDFQDSHHAGHLGFWIGMILAIFDLQVTPSFLPSLKAIGLLIHEKKWKTDFQMAAILDILSEWF